MEYWIPFKTLDEIRVDNSISYVIFQISYVNQIFLNLIFSIILIARYTKIFEGHFLKGKLLKKIFFELVRLKS